MFFQMPEPVLPDLLLQLYEERVSKNQLLRVYADGSCVHSPTPVSRYAAYACVVDLCANDDERYEQIHRWLATGTIPDSFQTVIIASRVQGLQTINRAEAQALCVISQLGPDVDLYSDSQYAVAMIGQSYHGYLPTSTCDANIDLRRKMMQYRVPPNHVHKIPAHLDPAGLSHWQDQYHACRCGCEVDVQNHVSRFC